MEDKLKKKIISELTSYLNEYIKDYEIECESEYYSTSFECEISGNDFLCDLELIIYGEYKDESFDHAFGLWVDPYRGWYATGAEVTNITNATLTDVDGNEWNINLPVSELIGNYV